MAVDALLAYGVRFYGSPDGVTYTELVDMVELGSPGDPESPDVDVTPLTPAAAWREFKTGLANAGSMDAKQHYNKTRFAFLRNLQIARTLYYWRMIYPDNANPNNASKVEFQAIVKKCTTSPLSNPDDEIHIPFQLRISGAITFTQGS